MPLDLIRCACRKPEPHVLTLCPPGTLGQAGLRIKCWERGHPRLAVWPSDWLVDEGRPWLVPIEPGPVAFEEPREYEIQQGSVMQSRPGWLAMVGMEIGDAMIRTESRPMDHCWALCLPELIAALRERTSVAWWGAGVQDGSAGDRTRSAPVPARVHGIAFLPNRPRI